MPIHESEELVLILAPAGRDAAVAAAILGEVGIPTRICAELSELVAGLDGAFGAIVAQEGLLRADRRGIADWVARQPPWSDFPFILLTLRGEAANSRHVEMLGNVTILERPFHPATLANAARAAVRARRRQREAEILLRERQETAERQALLIRELHHRVKNTLATVQAVVRATGRSSATIDDFHEAFSARLTSLAKTHALLTDGYWQTASLREIINNELGPYDDDSGRRISLDGPTVELGSDLAIPTGMAIHELTTNAAKYGALSVPTGRVDVLWDVIPDTSVRKLRLQWHERDGPPVVPPKRAGFGSTLLQRVLKQQCRADIQIDFEPAGLRFVMEAPLGDGAGRPGQGHIG